MELFLFMTFSASLVILSALLLRPLTGRIFPRAAQMVLWLAAALRLLIPLRVSSPIGLFGRTSVQSQPVSVSVHSEILTAPIPVPNHTALPISTVSVETVTQAKAVTPEEILFWVWFSGTLLMLSVILFFHIRNLFLCKNKLRDREAESTIPCTCTVYRCASVESPFVYGMLRPKIVLPMQLSGDDLTAVLAHEAAHILRWDILKKYLFAAALCVHWFNPLVWLMVYFSARDMEILCDIHALSMPGAPNAKTYAHALLNAEERRTVFNLGFKSNTEVRIMKILKKEKYNKLLMLVSVLLAVLLVTACTTTAKLPDNSSNTNLLSAEEHSEPLLPKEEKATSDESFFIQNGTYGFGGLQIGMLWEDAKTHITQLSGEADPVLTKHEHEKMHFLSFPYSVFEYNGTVTVYFLEDKLHDIFFTCPLDSNPAAEFARYTISEKLQKQLGAPDTHGKTLSESWSTKTVSLILSTVASEETGEEKPALHIQITRIHSEEREEQKNGGTEIQTEASPEISPETLNSSGSYESDTISTEEEAYLALEYLDTQIEHLKWQKQQIATLLNTWEQKDEEYLDYLHAALDILGENADDHEIREQIARLKAEDALGFFACSLPDTDGKECMQISVKREDTGEILSSHLVPKEDYTQYLEKLRLETREADVYVSFTPAK